MLGFTFPLDTDSAFGADFDCDATRPRIPITCGLNVESDRPSLPAMRPLRLSPRSRFGQRARPDVAEDRRSRLGAVPPHLARTGTYRMPKRLCRRRVRSNVFSSSEPSLLSRCDIKVHSLTLRETSVSVHVDGCKQYEEIALTMCDHSPAEVVVVPANLAILSWRIRRNGRIREAAERPDWAIMSVQRAVPPILSWLQRVPAMLRATWPCLSEVMFDEFALARTEHPRDRFGGGVEAYRNYKGPLLAPSAS